MSQIIRVGIELSGDAKGARDALGAVRTDLRDLTTDAEKMHLLEGDSAEAKALSGELSRLKEDFQSLATASRQVKILESAIDSVEQYKQRVTEANAQVARLQATLSEAYNSGADKSLIKSLERDLAAAEKAASRASDALERTQARVVQLNLEAEKTGVSTGNLAKRKEELAEASAAATARVEALSKAIKQEADYQAYLATEAERAAKAEKDADGAASVERQRQKAIAVQKEAEYTRWWADELGRAESAAQALDQAFRTLGTKPLKEITEETKRLQAALATIRSSGIIGADQERAVAAFNTRLAELRQQAQGVQPAAHSAADALNDVGHAGDSAGNMLGVAAKSVAGLAAAFVGLHGVGEIAKGIVQTGAAFETLEARLTSLLGSSEAAKEALAQIKQLAITTPFEVSALAESFTKLTAMGLQPTMTQMRALADTAATLGGGTESLQGVTLALGQAWAKNKLQGEEILQLAERGVPIWDLLAKATGKNIGELQKLSEAGMLGRDTILKLIDAMGEMNSGASDQLMSTFSGAVSNAKDALHEFYDMVAKAGVLEFLTSQVQSLLKEFDRMKASGELQSAAKKMADSLISIGEGIETAIHAVDKMSGVIKLSAEMWLAWRLSAMSIIPALGAVTSATSAAAVANTSAARAAGAAAASNAAVAASAAPVVAGNTAIATSSGAAAAGMTTLARAMSLVKGLTLVGVIEGVVQLGMEFFRAKSEAEKLERQVEKSLRPPPDNKLKDEFRLVATETEAARFKLTDYQRELQQLVGTGKSVADALDEVSAKADLGSPKGIVEMIQGLESIRTAAIATAEQVQVGLVNRLSKLTTQELKDFGLMAESAFRRGEISATQLGDSLDARVDAALKKIGVSATVSFDGFSSKFLDTARSLDVLISDFDRLKNEGGNAAELLRESFKNAINTASSQRDLDDLTRMLKEAGVAGRLSKLEITEFLEQVKKKSEDALPGINSVTEAFRKLGMKTPEELKKVADEAAVAFAKIKESSDFSVKGLAQVREAFQKYAEASIAANGGVATDMLKVQSGMYGLTIETDNAGKSVIRLSNANRDLSQTSGGAAGGIRDVAGAASGAKGAVDSYTASLERMAAAQAAADKKGVQGSDGVWRNAAGEHVSGQGGEVITDKNGKPVTDSTSLLDQGHQPNKTVDLTQWLYKATDSIEEVKAAQKYIGEFYEREKSTRLTGNVGDQTNYTRLNKIAVEEAAQKALAAARIELATGKQVDIGHSIKDVLAMEMAKVNWGNQLTGEGGIQTSIAAARRAGEKAENQTASVTININGQAQKIDLASSADRDGLVAVLRQLESDRARSSHV